MTKTYQLKTTAIKSEFGKTYRKIYYLNKTKNGNTYTLGSDEKSNVYQNVFTQNEIDNFPENIKDINWEKVEVTNHD